MAVLAFDHLQLTMPRGGEDRARSFYVDLLGMTVVPQPPILARSGGLWVRSGDVELHLALEDDFRAARKGHPGLVVDDLDELAARFEAAGFVVDWDERYPQFRRFYVRDPFGNRLELMQPATS